VSPKYGAGNAFIHRLRTFIFSGAVHLSIQKLLAESTDSAGLLVCHNRPIVFFKIVALNFPPLEQGPAGKMNVGTCFSPQAAMLDFRPETLENSERLRMAGIQKSKHLREANSENQFLARSLC
jgi:hypothetical protein